VAANFAHESHVLALPKGNDANLELLSADADQKAFEESAHLKQTLNLVQDVLSKYKEHILTGNKLIFEPTVA
jgi:hypothetical protein